MDSDVLKELKERHLGFIGKLANTIKPRTKDETAGEKEDEFERATERLKALQDAREKIIGRYNEEIHDQERYIERIRVELRAAARLPAAGDEFSPKRRDS